MSQIVTQHGSATLPVNFVHKVPASQLNVLKETGDILAPIFDFNVLDYTVVTKTVKVTVTVTITTNDAAELEVTALENDVTYNKSKNNVVSITVTNNNDNILYEPSGITLSAEQFSYTSQRVEPNLVYTYTGTYQATTSSIKAGSYYYIAKLSAPHTWDTTDKNPLHQKYIAILPWIIKPQESFYSQIALMETDILNIVIALNSNGYNQELANTLIRNFNVFDNYLMFLNNHLIADALQGNTTIVVENNENIFVGNQYVLTYSKQDTLIEVQKISTLYDSENERLSYEITLKDALQYYFPKGTKLTRSSYYVMNNVATVGRKYKAKWYLNSRNKLTNLSTGSVVQRNATEGATELKLNKVDNLTVDTTYHLVENRKDIRNWQTVTISKIDKENNTVTLKEGLTTAVSVNKTNSNDTADPSPTLFRTEGVGSSLYVYQTWANRTDLDEIRDPNNDELADKLKKDLYLTTAASPTLSDTGFNTLIDQYWTKVKITSSFDNDTKGRINCTRETDKDILTPGKEYFVTTKDGESYGVITVKNNYFTSSTSLSGQISLEQSKTKVLTKKTETQSSLHEVKGITENNPLYVLEMLPPLITAQSTVFYYSWPTGNPNQSLGTTYDITNTKYNEDRKDSTKLLGNFVERVTIYKRIVPFPLSVIYRQAQEYAVDSSNAILTGTQDWSDNDLIGDFQFWEKSDIAEIFEQTIYGLKFEWKVSVEHLCIESGTYTFSGYEGFERVRFLFNFTSSSQITKRAWLFGDFENIFEKMPETVIVNALASTKGSLTETDYQLQLYYVQSKNLDNLTLSYDTELQGYQLLYTDNDEGQTKVMTNYMISALQIPDIGDTNILSEVTYNFNDYVNWYIDYDENCIVFPHDGRLVINGTMRSISSVNTSGHTIKVSVQYDCQENQLPTESIVNKTKVPYLISSKLQSSGSGIKKAPFIYDIPASYKDLTDVSLRFILTINAQNYSQAINGMLPYNDITLTLSRTELQRYGITTKTDIYDGASFSGYSYTRQPNPYTHTMRPVAVASYAVSGGHIPFDQVIDYLNGVRELEEIVRYSSTTSMSTFAGYAGISTSSSLTVTTTDKPSDYTVMEDPTEEGICRMTFKYPETPVYNSSTVNIFVTVKGSDLFNESKRETFISKFVYTYCTQITSTERYTLKNKNDILQTVINGGSNVLASYVVNARDGDSLYRHPSAILLCYVTKDDTYEKHTTTYKDINYSYYVAQSGENYTERELNTLLAPLPTNSTYYTTITLTSGNFADVTLYKFLIHNTNCITGVNYIFCSVKLYRSKIDIESGHYFGVLQNSDISLITDIPTTSYNPTKKGTDSNNNIIYWEATSDPDIVIMYCAIKYAQPACHYYCEKNWIDLTFSGVLGPKIIGFVNKWFDS